MPQTRKKPTPPTGPAGGAILVGKDGPQLIRSTGKRWTDEAEELFLDHLAATCNVTDSAQAAGFSKATVNARRRRDPGFAQRWEAALDTGAARIQALLLYRCEEALEGRTPDTELPIPPMSVKDALAIIGHHRRSVERGPRSRRQWARPRSLDEMRDSILAKLEAFVPYSSMSFEKAQTACSASGCASQPPPQDERRGNETFPNPVRAEEGPKPKAEDPSRSTARREDR